MIWREGHGLKMVERQETWEKQTVCSCGLSAVHSWIGQPLTTLPPWEFSVWHSLDSFQKLVTKSQSTSEWLLNLVSPVLPIAIFFSLLVKAPVTSHLVSCPWLFCSFSLQVCPHHNHQSIHLKKSNLGAPGGSVG